MSTTEHPITPPPELVQQWMDLPLSEEERLRAAYRAGANQQLEACIEYFHEYDASWGEHSDLVTGLRAAFRPKPLSQADLALEANSKPTPNLSQIGSSLVERVYDAMVFAAAGSEARAAIREVAAWLDSIELHAAAARLRLEAEQ